MTEELKIPDINLATNAASQQTQDEFFESLLGQYDYQDSHSVNEYVKEMYALAKDGIGGAAGELGCIYENGFGSIEQDYEKAFRWYSIGAEKGSIYSARNVGMFYFEGKAVEQDYEAAIHWLSLATEYQDPYGEFYLARMMMEGIGCEIDQAQAIPLLEKSAMERTPESISYLAAYYLNIAELDRFYRWAKFGIELEDIDCYLMLAESYLEGNGTPANAAEAKRLYEEAVNLGSEIAIEQLKKIGDDVIANKQPSHRIFDPRFVNCDLDLASIAKVINTNRDNQDKFYSLNLTLLLSGKYGSGREKLASYFLDKLNVSYNKYYSHDLIVGYADDNIAKIESIFAEARVSGEAVIFIDNNFMFSAEVNITGAHEGAAYMMDSSRYVEKLLQELRNFDLPFIFITPSEDKVFEKLRSYFQFKGKCEYMSKEGKQLAFEKIFSIKPPKDLDKISGLILNDFERSYDRLSILGKLGNVENIIKELKIYSDQKDYKDPVINFNPDIINSSTNLDEFIQKLSESGSSQFSMLIYGPPGTGKSEYLRYMAKQLGYEVISKKVSELKGALMHETEKLIAEFFREGMKRQAFLILDEIDSMIPPREKEERSFEVSYINEMLLWLETYPYPIAGTTNSMERIDKAALRRFLFKVKFNYMDKEHAKIAFEHFYERPAPKELDHIGGLVSSDFNTAKKKALVFNEIEQDDKILNLLKQEVQSKTGSNILHYSVGDVKYNMDLMNTKTDIKYIEEKLCGENARRDFSMLIYGPPGTGKSLYLRSLASKMGIEVIVKKYSDIVSQWVGETEQKIAATFMEAADKKAFLIIDEADSLLSSRDDSLQSWEVSRVNEMLTWMESHEYPFACTTNLSEKLDKASLRRFLFSFKMDYLKNDQIDKAMNFFFGYDALPEVKALSKLTPAIFANAKKKAEILAVNEDKKEVAKLIVDEMKIYDESSSGKIGFIH